MAQVGAIVLAAGASTRMGRQKLLLPFAGTTVISHVVRELRLARVQDVCCVTGFEPERVREALSGEGVRFAHNVDYTQGMLSSVRTGLAAASPGWSAALIVLGDQPLLHAAQVSTLAGEHARVPEAILVPAHGGRRGHPLLLPRRYWAEAATQHADLGLRGLLHAHADSVRAIEMDSEDVLSDIDTPADYEAALERVKDRGNF